jgi:hypothetical protein
MPKQLYRAERCRDLADECRAIAALCVAATEMQTHYSRMAEQYSKLAEAEELGTLALGIGRFDNSNLADGVSRGSCAFLIPERDQGLSA